ncbi:MAG: BREX-4 system phosphatase PglZ [Christensenellaceae bacterium]|jgi:hypothetical protein|nr:BREX-4 system phosphatase PglZ [Christensenellaceae bacterium]
MSDYKEATQNYLKDSKLRKPYFIFISDEQYKDAIEYFKGSKLEVVPMSSFCYSEDKIPDVDKFTAYLSEADVNVNSNKFVVTGLGEFLALEGRGYASSQLSILKDYNISAAKAILLIRCLGSLVDNLKSDVRFDNRRYIIVDGAISNISFALVDQSIEIPVLKGFKEILKALEGGLNGEVAINTQISLDKSMLTIHKISNAFEAIKSLAHNSVFKEVWFEDAQWMELLSELQNYNFMIEEVFRGHNLNTETIKEFYDSYSKNIYKYLYFIYLKVYGIRGNEYLQFVISKTDKYIDLERNILNKLLDLLPNDPNFDKYYDQRKKLMKNLIGSGIVQFAKDKHKMDNGIYVLTDNTLAEREEIVAWLATNHNTCLKMDHIYKKLKNIYPNLDAYLKEYVFKSPNIEVNEQFTEYFNEYKRQKLYNKIEDKFMQDVERLAKPPRIYNNLKFRESILETIDKNNTYLYWMDALGVEYLGLIETLAGKHGLLIQIDIARAELPTTTRFNKEFFDVWPDESRKKLIELDQIKHAQVGGYNFEKNQLPIHLAKEIDVITEMINKAASKLKQNDCERILIVSDHGASRLAVIARKEEKYDTGTSGVNSGRCCEVFRPYDLEFASEENDYIVLANYGRFKGSRASNVEVHGGASLEEIVIPVIQLTVKSGSITVKLISDKIVVDYKTCAKITLSVYPTPKQNVLLTIDNKQYKATKNNDHTFSVELTDIKKAGEYNADVFVGDNLVGNILIKTQGKSASINKDFDDLI